MLSRFRFYFEAHSLDSVICASFALTRALVQHAFLPSPLLFGPPGVQPTCTKCTHLLWSFFGSCIKTCTHNMYCIDTFVLPVTDRPPCDDVGTVRRGHDQHSAAQVGHLSFCISQILTDHQISKLILHIQLA